MSSTSLLQPLPGPELCREDADFDRHFILGEKLGQGHFGHVHAVLPRSGATEGIAVKIIDLEPAEKEERSVRSAEREFRLWKCMGKHPNIINMHSFFVKQSTGPRAAYILMERCGQSLRALISGPSLSEERHGSMVAGLLSALCHVHGHNVVHRDVKLDNLLCFDATVKLCDFGISKQLPGCGYLVSRGSVGTPAYMAPEVLEAQCYDFAIDLWAAGVCFYRLFFGEMPYRPPPGKRHREAVKVVIRSGVPPSFRPSGASQPPEGATAMMRALLARNATERPTAKAALRLDYVFKHTELGSEGMLSADKSS